MSDDHLEDLIAAAGKAEPSDFVPPANDVVQRYVLGTASPSERKQVREALERSSTFRRSILEMAEDVDRASALGISTSYSGQPLSRLDRISRWSQRILRVPVLLPVAAVILLLMIGVWRSDRPVGLWELVEERLDKEELISLVTRSPGQSSKSYTTARDAAVAEFRSMLKWEDGEFMFPSLPYQQEKSSDGTLITLRLIAEEKFVIGEWTRAVPDSEPTIWLLALPSRDLRRIPEAHGVIDAIWNPGWGLRGCVTWTYKLGNEYYAAPGITFEKPR